MDVARAAVKGVLQQPVNDTNDMMIVGIQLAAPAEFHQLLEVGDGAAEGTGPAHVRFGLLQRAADTVELRQVTTDVGRTCQYARHGLA